MFTLTERRMEKISPILEAYSAFLAERNAFDCMSLERELRQSLDTGYGEIKQIMCQLIKRADFALVAAFYMQHVNAPGPISEFKAPLAEFYGVGRYDSPECDEARNQYWKR